MNHHSLTAKRLINQSSNISKTFIACLTYLAFPFDGPNGSNNDKFNGNKMRMELDRNRNHWSVCSVYSPHSFKSSGGIRSKTKERHVHHAFPDRPTAKQK